MANDPGLLEVRAADDDAGTPSAQAMAAAADAMASYVPVLRARDRRQRMSKHDECPTVEHCPECWHDAALHASFLYPYWSTNSGVVLCRTPRCECAQVWALPGRPVPELPDDETLGNWRALIQRGGIA